MLLALVGPTASGKTQAGVSLALRLGAEVVSVDSMLVYRGMDIGTATPTVPERRGVPHHLIDVAAASERFTVARYQRLARAALGEIAARGARPILVGGSGLYFRAVVDELAFPGEDPAVRAELEREARAVGVGALYRRLAGSDPAAASKIEAGNVRRLVRALEVPAITGRPFSGFTRAWERYEPDRVRAAGVRIAPAILRERIERRVRSMLDAGWVDEVRTLVEQGCGPWLTSSQAIGYAELARHLEGSLSLDEAADATVRRTKELARRQMAWFEGAAEVVDAIDAYLRAA
jgi:tRNA dimethylallyltransferase